MFECKYKFSLDDNIKCAKYVYNSQKRKQDKIIAILLPILFVGMLALLIVDIVNDKSIVWDIVLLVLLAILQIMYLVMPAMVIRQTKKSYKSQDLGNMDNVKIILDPNSNMCNLSFQKGDEEIGKKALPLKTLTSYIEDKDDLILVFNNIEYVLIKKDALTGDLNKLKSVLKKAMAKSNK